MKAATVKSNNGETAVFSDGATVNRNLLMRGIGSFKAHSLQPDAFKWAFEIGLTSDQITERLNDPDVATMTAEDMTGNPKIGDNGGVKGMGQPNRTNFRITKRWSSN